MLNSTLQWAGTACLLTMYILMSFYKDLFPANLVAGCLGGLCYFAWSVRTRNKAQMIVNLAGITICLAGLYEALG